VIFANILLDPLKALATPMTRLVAANGHVVLSGLLAGQAGAALASYRARGLVLVRRMTLESWATLILVRPRTRRAVRCHRAAGYRYCGMRKRQGGGRRIARLQAAQ
jgi:hypothetical protein